MWVHVVSECVFGFCVVERSTVGAELVSALGFCVPHVFELGLGVAMFGLLRRAVPVLLGVALVVGGSAAFATGVTLPDTGVDVPGTVTAMVTFLGTAVASIIGAYAAFKAIKVALRWFGRIGG